MAQLRLLDGFPSLPNEIVAKRSGAFTDNMKLPIHRWFRYSAGFSGEWVERILQSCVPDTPSVLDPFCGSGTTLIAAAKFGARAVGFEQHPFISRIASIKLNREISIARLNEAANLCISSAMNAQKSQPDSDSTLLLKCYSKENLCALEALKHAYFVNIVGSFEEEISDLVWLALTCILRECSSAGTAQWQYVQPNKSKARVRDPFEAMSARIMTFSEDLRYAHHVMSGNQRIVQTDARFPEYEDSFDLVVTSPPYPNNYDYADATRLEMTFWGDIAGWSDLQEAVRHLLIRSCSQHSAAERLKLETLLREPQIEPIRSDLRSVCEELDVVRQTKGGKKTYHTMVAAYFCDLALVWSSLRRLVVPRGRAAFVIGDSAPYGVHVPCDKWLGKLAIAIGFKSFTFEKLRDRNLKWKNRKHRVPLKEGILWVEG